MDGLASGVYRKALLLIGLFFVLMSQRAKRLGPLFVLEKSSGSIVLPRENMRFSAHQVEHLQALTVPGKGNHLFMTLSELNLITRTPSGRARWSILGEIDDLQRVDGELQRIISDTDIPIYQYHAKKKQGVEYVEISDMRAS